MLRSVDYLDSSFPRVDVLVTDLLLPPLIMHTSHVSETHYFPMNTISSRRILLHSHGSAPYAHPAPQPLGVHFNIYSSGLSGCDSDLQGFDISIDWFATLGRWAPRYFTALASWAVGIISLMLFKAWGEYDKGCKCLCEFIYWFYRYIHRHAIR